MSTQGDEAPRRSAELELWFAWKRAQELVRGWIAEDIAAATGLSDPDFGILIRVDDAGGTLRQNQLAASMGWDRSRLSHQLTRMESRGLLTRRRVGGGVEVVISDAGRSAASSARPVHAAAVHRHLVAPLTAAQLDALPELLERLTEAD